MQNNTDNQITATNELKKKALLIKKKLKDCFPSTKFSISHTKEQQKMCVYIRWNIKPTEYEMIHELYEFNCGVTYSRNDSATQIAILPYSQAIARQKKGGGSLSFIQITPVCWDKEAQQQLELLSFKTIPSREVPIPQNLPYGYEMIAHPSWLEIENELIDPSKIEKATFDELNLLREDIYIYTQKIDKRFEFEIDRDDYWDFIASIEASWEPLDIAISNLDRRIEKKLRLAYPLSIRDSVMAPNLEEYLTNSLGQTTAQALMTLLEAFKLNDL